MVEYFLFHEIVRNKRESEKKNRNEFYLLPFLDIENLRFDYFFSKQKKKELINIYAVKNEKILLHLKYVAFCLQPIEQKAHKAKFQCTC